MQRSTVDRLENPWLNGTMSMNANSTWTPGSATRSSFNSSISSRSRRCCSSSFRVDGTVDPPSCREVRCCPVPTLRKRLRELLPDGDVHRAVGGEWLAPPARPPVAQRHPGHLRHQVELSRPRVAERHRHAPVLAAVVV